MRDVWNWKRDRGLSDEKMADAEAIVHDTVNFIEELHSTIINYAI